MDECLDLGGAELVAGDLLAGEGLGGVLDVVVVEQSGEPVVEAGGDGGFSEVDAAGGHPPRKRPSMAAWDAIAVRARVLMRCVRRCSCLRRAT